MNRKAVLILISLFLAFYCHGTDFATIRESAKAGRRVELSGSLEAIVTSDCTSSNTETCPNIAGNMVAIAESARTVYVQNEDGSMGMRMILRGYYGNRFRRGDKVRINLEGSTVLREDNPTRYTIENVDITNVVVLSHGNALPLKKKSISELTSDDIYTLVTLDGLEFFKKEGGYINVFERAVQITELNRMLSHEDMLGYPAALECVDTWPSLMLDKNGDRLYMLVNSTCTWRRNNMGVPQGVGDVCGVIVHSELSHYGNSLGEYSIRPMDVSDIHMDKAPQSNYVEICGWHWNYNKYRKLDMNAEVGRGELSVCGDIKIGLDDEYDARHSFDGWKTARMTGSRSCAALRLDTKCSGWYGQGAGIYVNTDVPSTPSGKLCFCFSFLAGRDHSFNSVDYPVDWKVSYSVDGRNYTDLPQRFDLRPIMFTNVQHGKRRAVLHNGLAAGFTEHVVELPSSIKGKNVTIKVSVASDRTATMPEAYDGPCREGKAKSCQDADTIIRFGDISVICFNN